MSPVISLTRGSSNRRGDGTTSAIVMCSIGRFRTVRAAEVATLEETFGKGLAEEPGTAGD